MYQKFNELQNKGKSLYQKRKSLKQPEQLES